MNESEKNLILKNISETEKAEGITEVSGSREHLLGLGQLLSQVGLIRDSLMRKLFSGILKGQTLIG